MVIDYDFSDVDAFFELGWKEVREEVESVAKEAIKHAKEHGTYKDWTYQLREGNEYHVGEYASLDMWNNMFYAPYVEARKRNVLSDTALFARDELVKRFQ